MAMLTLGFLLFGVLGLGRPDSLPRTLGRIVSPQVPTPSASAQKCVAFSSGGRVRYGRSFIAHLPAGLELRLRPEGDFGWSITIGQPNGGLDYIWVVSPPFRTAPQRQIGPAYGLTARESVAFVRQLRFVLTDRDYRAALKVVREEVASREMTAKIERLGKGRLTLHIGRFGLRTTARPEPWHEALDWIEFKGEACVPR